MITAVAGPDPHGPVRHRRARSASLAIADAGVRACSSLVVVNALGTVLSTAFVAPFTAAVDLAAVPRPADAQGGLRRRADGAGGDHRVVSLVLRVLTAEPPLDPSADEARSLLRRELVHPEYHERNVLQQILNWIDRLVERRLDAASTRRRCRPSPRWSRFLLLGVGARPGCCPRARRTPRAAARPRARARPTTTVTAAELRAARRAGARRGPQRGGRGRRLPRARGAPGRARPARRPARAPPPTRSPAPSAPSTPTSGRGSTGSAALFDAVRYGDRPATRDQAADVLALDDELAGRAMSATDRGARAAPAAAASAGRRCWSSLGPGRRGRRRRSCSPASGADRYARRSTPTTPAPTGAQALARVLDDQGVDVDGGPQRRRPRGHRRSTPTRPSWSPRPSSSARAPSTGSLEHAAPRPAGASSSPARAPPRRSASPRCPRASRSTTPVERRLRRPAVRRAVARRRLRRSPTPSATAASPTTDGALLAEPRPGSALLGAGEALSNDQVLRADNAAVGAAAARAVRPAGLVRPVARRPRRPTTGSAWRPCCPAGSGPALWLLARSRRSRCSLWRARRLGPLAIEPLPVVVKAIETTRSRGRLYRKAGDRAHAAAVLRAAARVRAAERLRLGRHARPATPWCATSPATPAGRSPRSTRSSARRAAPPATDHDLITLADRAGRARQRGTPHHDRDTPPDPATRGPRAAGRRTRRGREGRRRPGRRGLRPAGRPALRRPRADGGRARRRQDAAGAHPRRRAVGRHPAGAVHPRPDARRHHRVDGDRQHGRASSASARARSSPTCCSPTRSTGRRRRPSRRCSRRWRRARSRSTASRVRCRGRSWSPRPRTRSSTKAPTRCPRRSSTGSCSRWCCRSPTAPPSWRSCAGTRPASTRATSPAPGYAPVAGAADIAAGQRGGRAGAGHPRGRRLHRRHRPRDPRVAVAEPRRQPARCHRAAALRAGLGLADRPRLRDPRRRQVARPRDARAPARACARRPSSRASTSPRCSPPRSARCRSRAE